MGQYNYMGATGWGILHCVRDDGGFAEFRVCGASALPKALTAMPLMAGWAYIYNFLPRAGKSQHLFTLPMGQRKANYQRLNVDFTIFAYFSNIDPL